MTSTRSSTTNTKTRSATRRLESFRQRFGDGHFYLACHAALPLALTPDLLYSLWANFQRDTHGEAIEIPWIAVADLMLSNLCKEVGNELYEMDQPIRDELLKQLQNDSRFGLERTRELADFVMAYVKQQLDSPDLDARDLAQGQQWRALTYKNPSEAAHSIATVLAQLSLNDKAEWIRMAALLNSLEQPLEAFQPLLIYANAMADLARGNIEVATAKISGLLNQNNEIQVAQVSLPVPDALKTTLPEPEPITTPREKPLIERLKGDSWLLGGSILIPLALFAVLIHFLQNQRYQPPLSTSPIPSISPSTRSFPSQPTPSPSVFSGLPRSSVVASQPQPPSTSTQTSEPPTTSSLPTITSSTSRQEPFPVPTIIKSAAASPTIVATPPSRTTSPPTTPSGSGTISPTKQPSSSTADQLSLAQIQDQISDIGSKLAIVRGRLDARERDLAALEAKVSSNNSQQSVNQIRLALASLVDAVYGLKAPLQIVDQRFQALTDPIRGPQVMPEHLKDRSLYDELGIEMVTLGGRLDALVTRCQTLDKQLEVAQPEGGRYQVR